MARKGKKTPQSTPLKSPVSNGKNSNVTKPPASGDESSPEKNTKASKLEQILKKSVVKDSPADVKKTTKESKVSTIIPRHINFKESGESNVNRNRKKIDIGKILKIHDLSKDDLDSDNELYEDSDDGIIYAEDSDDFFGEDSDDDLFGEDFDDEELSGEEFEFEDSEMDSVDEEEEVPQLIPASDAEDESAIVKVVERLDKKNPKKFEMITQGRVAIKALTDTEQKKSKKQLFGNQATGVYLHIRYKLPAYPKPKQPSRHYFELPFPEKAAENSSICLILPDLYHAKADKSEPDVDKQSREWYEIFREKFGLTSRDISKIYTLNQLKREVHTQQDKRKLMETYDIILIDRTIMPITLFHLEKWSQRGFKMPLPLTVASKDVPEQIRRAYKLSFMDARPGIDDVSIRIGNLSQSGSQLAANFVSAVDCLFKNVPGSELNIKTVDIQIDQSEVVLPIYVDFTPKKSVKMPKPPVFKPESYVEDLDTLPMGYKIKFNGIDFKVVDENGKEVEYLENDEADALDDLPDPKPSELSKERRKKEFVSKITSRKLNKKKVNNIVKSLKYLKRKRELELEPVVKPKINKKKTKVEETNGVKQSGEKKVKADEDMPTKKRKLDKGDAKVEETKVAKMAKKSEICEGKVTNPPMKFKNKPLSTALKSPVSNGKDSSVKKQPSASSRLEDKVVSKEKTNKKEVKGDGTNAKQLVGGKIKADEGLPSKKRKLGKDAVKVEETKVAKKANKSEAGEDKASIPAMKKKGEPKKPIDIPEKKTKTVIKPSGALAGVSKKKNKK